MTLFSNNRTAFILSSALVISSSITSLEASALSADVIDNTKNGVTILGAGVAGLSAARALKAAGIPFHIFEAKDCAGGRIHAKSLADGTIVNEGGEWIEKDQKDIWRLVNELGIPLQEENFGRDITVTGESGPVTLSETAQDFSFLSTSLAKRAEELAATQGYYGADHKFYSLEDVLPEGLTAHQRNLLDTFVSGDYGLSMADVSSVEIHSVAESLGEYHTLLRAKNSRFVPKFVINKLAKEYRVTGGMGVLIDAMVAEVGAENITFNAPMTSLKKRADGVFDVGVAAEVLESDAVINTIPFSVLRGIGAFDGASIGLEKDQLDMIQKLSYGANAKVFVPQAPEGDGYRYKLHTDAKVIAWETPNHGAQVLFMGGDEGAGLTAASAQALAQDLTGYGGAGAVAVEFKNWSQDSYALGSYSVLSKEIGSFTPSETDPTMRHFARPVAGFAFAGEHTETDSAYIDSAVRSGQRAAAYMTAQLKSQ